MAWRAIRGMSMHEEKLTLARRDKPLASRGKRPVEVGPVVERCFAGRRPAPQHHVALRGTPRRDIAGRPSRRMGMKQLSRCAQHSLTARGLSLPG